MIAFPKTIQVAELRKILDENHSSSDFSSTDRMKIEIALESGRDFVVCDQFLPPRLEPQYSYLRLERKSARTLGLERAYGDSHALVLAGKVEQWLRIGST